MKKFFLFICLALLKLSAMAQTFTVSKATVESDEVFTVSAVGETPSAYFTSMNVQSAGIVTNPNNGSSFINPTQPYEINFFQYNIQNSSPSSFKIKYGNSDPNLDYAITVRVLVTIAANGTNTQNGVVKTFTITVKHKISTTYYSAARTGPFTRNNCPSGYSSTPVSYTLPQGAATSTVSPDDANSKAAVLFNTNGQAYANAQGVCEVTCTSAPNTPGVITATTGPTIGCDRIKLEIQPVSGAISYKWYLDGVLIPLVNSRSFTRVLENDGENHVVEVQAVNPCGTSAKRSATVTGWCL